MLASNSDRLLMPRAEIYINDNRQPALEQDLLSLNVSEGLGLLSHVQLQLPGKDLINNQYTWVDDDQLKIGNTIAVYLGYGNRLEKIIFAEITNLSSSFSQESACTINVDAYDLGHRLQRGMKAQSFKEAKLSDIVATIARAAGLKVDKIQDTQIKLDYVLLHNQTAMQFLQQQAEKIGYKVWVEDKTLYFQKPRRNALRPITLSFDRDELLEFSARLSTMEQISQVETRSWDIKKKQEVVSIAKGSPEAPSPGGETSGSKTATQVFGTTKIVNFASSADSKAETDQMAAGLFEEIAMDYIQGDGSCQGRTDLQAGGMVNITGVGQRFSGQYMITDVSHSFSLTQGYRTDFTVKRNRA
ncbi:contractile injection system protein, VgrG/Pvc8 family [Trichocoleus desertorum AS-A10]|uniref:phage late control D family protein n=1 Tax=Trichocoleus desertorum TaxID=1481672 RepID=UPI00329789E8